MDDHRRREAMAFAADWALAHYGEIAANLSTAVNLTSPKNLVLINIIRDITENETSCHLSPDATDDELARAVTDRTVRRKEILGEIFNFLRKEEMAERVNA